MLKQRRAGLPSRQPWGRRSWPRGRARSSAVRLNSCADPARRHGLRPLAWIDRQLPQAREKRSASITVGMIFVTKSLATYDLRMRFMLPVALEAVALK